MKHNLMTFLEQVPDTVKVGGATAAPILDILGIPVEQWGFLISAIVGILFIIEKIPRAAKSIMIMIEWWKNAKRKKQE